MTGYIAPLLMLASINLAVAQQDTAAINAIQKFQHELNAEYRNSETSPLSSEKLKEFKGHDFFPIDLKYRVEAELTITSTEPFFKMMTSNNKPRNFRQYGLLTFRISNQKISIPVYQSERLMGNNEYADYLFLPFTDLTNGHTTYSAGRYIDLRIPAESNRIRVDFNQAYNPLCAYSDRFSCPIVPAKNHINLEIQAGVRHTEKH